MIKRKDGRYQDQIKLDGMTTTKYFYGKTQREVKQKMAVWTAESRAGSLFADSADSWDNVHTENVAYNTAAAYVAPLKRAKAHFKDRRMKDITPDEIQAFIRELAGKDYARRTVQMHLDMLNMIFDHAITQPGSIIKANPCTSVRIPSGLKQTRRKPPEDDQLEKIKAERQADFWLFAYFLLYTGLRRGELLALRWENIDRKEKTIHVLNSVYYEGNQPKLKPPKSDAGTRDIVLLDVLADVLPPKKKKGYVFGGEKPLSKTQVRKQWLSYCRAVDLAEKTETVRKGRNNREYKTTKWIALVTPHQFRHAFATMLYDADIDESAAQTLMGHASIVVTKDIYTHIKQRRKDEAAQKLNAFVNGSVESKT